MDMVMTLYMGSWAPPAISLPRVTHRPSLTMRRTGQIPEQMFTLESPQWTTTTPASRMAARSRSSDQTQCAMRVWSFHRPYLSYVSQYWLHSGCSSFTQAISLVLSDRWDWTYSPRSLASFPSWVISSLVQLGVKRGVRMGLMCSKWQASSQRSVSCTDSSVVSCSLPGRPLRSMLTLPT